jgi:hypothetical protein
VVVAQAELATRAQHPVGPLTTQLAPGDLQAVGHGGADGGQRHQIADRHVERTAADLQRLAVAGVDVDQLDPVGVGVGTQVEHPGHDDAVEPFAQAVERLDGHAQVAHRVPSSTGSPSKGANSRSHDSRTFIAPLLGVARTSAHGGGRIIACS